MVSVCVVQVFGLGEGLREDEERLEALQQRLQGVDLGELKLAHKLGERLDKAQRGLRDMRRETDKIENRCVTLHSDGASVGELVQGRMASVLTGPPCVCVCVPVLCLQCWVRLGWGRGCCCGTGAVRPWWGRRWCRTP